MPLLTVLLAGCAIITAYFVMEYSYDIRSSAQVDPPSIKLRTFTPAPSQPPTTAPAIVVAQAAGPVPVTTPRIGGRTPGLYCIDDEDPDMCDDNSSHLVPKGTGGAAGSCGTVIENTHKLVDALPQVMKGTRDSLTKNVATSCGSTGPSSGYISTYLVIDAYNLSGFGELSKTNPTHVSPSGLFGWWQTAGSGYEYIPYSPTVVQQFAVGQKDLTGCVMFMKTSSSYHIGIVNVLEVYNQNGDGVISILQSGTRMYIDRFPVSGWSIRNTSTNQTTTSGVAGFGCHT